MRRRLRRSLIALVPSLAAVALLVPAAASAAKWSIQETPAVPKVEANGSLTSVYCTSSESCTAVGYYENSGRFPLVERWNGTEWSPKELPNPTGGSSGELKSVSCSSSEACTAVGSYYNSALKQVTLAERWNGKEWSVQTTPNPTEAKSSSLSGVSCASSEMCTAVGHYVNSSSVEVLLAERWNGKEWAIGESKIPTGAKSSSLSGVSCASGEACTAVGHYVNSSSVEVPLAERWNGTTWSIQETLTPTGAKSSSLSGVSCASGEACTAVGHYVNSSSVEVPLAERWNGKTWSIGETKVPTGAKSSSLSGVSCTSSEACTATGRYVNSSSVEVTLAERWNGKEWAIQTTPNPTEGKESSIVGVSCTSAKVCIAVGRSKGKLLAEHWNGTEWTIHTTPSPKIEGTAWLNGVSCTASAACTAVGSGGLAERWNGTAWSIQTTPNPGGEMTSVSCTSATACTGVGNEKSGTLAESWNGTEWKVQTTPNPTGATTSRLEAVSCISAAECTATGWYESSEKTYTLAERWNGTEWAIQTTPNPSEGHPVHLDGVSCTSSTSCAAGGYYYTPGLEIDPMAMHWNGTEWTLQTVPKPVKEREARIEAISCTSSAACTGTGSYSPSSTEDYKTMAQRWNGTEWAIQSTLNPSGASSLDGVSCSAAAACTAVGETSVSEELLTLAEAWNGTEWLIQTTPNPTGAKESHLSATSCTSSTVCVAAGFYRKIRAGAPVPLVERYQ